MTKLATLTAVTVLLAVMCLTTSAQTNDGQRVNGQMFNPNGIPMIYVEGNGTVNGFYIGMFEVTQRAWKTVMDVNFNIQDANNEFPVTSVSWDNVKLFIRKLNDLTGRNYRLPTEDEWEYASKGGNKSKGYKFSGSNTLDDVAWYKTRIQKIGGKQPNELGLFDMSGNVSEWCEDCWGFDCAYRVVRGSNFTQDETNSLKESRIRQKPATQANYIGFRLVLP